MTPMEALRDLTERIERGVTTLGEMFVDYSQSTSPDPARLAHLRSKREGMVVNLGYAHEVLELVDAPAYEYGIGRDRMDLQDPHRTGMTLRQAREWVQECVDLGMREGAFFTVRRETGDWERCDD